MRLQGACDWQRGCSVVTLRFHSTSSDGDLPDVPSNLSIEHVRAAVRADVFVASPMRCGRAQFLEKLEIFVAAVEGNVEASVQQALEVRPRTAWLLGPCSSALTTHGRVVQTGLEGDKLAQKITDLYDCCARVRCTTR